MTARPSGQRFLPPCTRIYRIYNILGWTFGYELQVDVAFENKPATVKFSVLYNLNGVAKIALFPEVYVVQVKVANPKLSSAFQKVDSKKAPKAGPLFGNRSVVSSVLAGQGLPR